MRALLLSLLFMLVVLSSLLFGKAINRPETLIVREVVVGLPPPPPPPPTMVESVQDAQAIQMDLLAGLDQGTPLLQASMSEPQLEPAAMPEPDLSADLPDLQAAMSFDWSGFGLSELDAAPQLLTDLRMRFPRSLLARGIRRAAVELRVMIDEEGRVFLKDVVRNSYPELRPRIEAVMRRARFSPPRKDGAKVRAVFVWPIEFNSDA